MLKLMIVKERKHAITHQKKRRNHLSEAVYIEQRLFFREMGSETQLRKHPKRSSTPEQIKDTSVFGYDLFVKLNYDN